MTRLAVLCVLTVLCVVRSEGAASAQFEDMAFVKNLRAESDSGRLELKLQAALAMLSGTPTGKPLAALVLSGRVKLDTKAASGPMYEDGTDKVSYPREFIRDGDVWQQAVILAHELEHARQDHLGLRGPDARGAREVSAFLVQSRVWVELGGKVRPQDLSRNGMNSHDMLAWLEYPSAAVAAISVRGTMPVELSRPEVARYYHEIQREEDSWRAQWHSRFPKADSKASAAFILNQAAGFGQRSCRFK